MLNIFMFLKDYAIFLTTEIFFKSGILNQMKVNFLGTKSRAFWVFNKRTKTFLESISVVIHDTGDKYVKVNDNDDQVFPYTSFSVTSTRFDSASSGNDSRVVSTSSSSINESVRDDSLTLKVINSNDDNKDTGSTNSFDIQIIAPSTRVQKNHPSSSIICEISGGITIRKKECRDYAKMIANMCFTSQMELVIVVEALKDD